MHIHSINSYNISCTQIFSCTLCSVCLHISSLSNLSDIYSQTHRNNASFRISSPCYAHGAHNSQCSTCRSIRSWKAISSHYKLSINSYHKLDCHYTTIYISLLFVLLALLEFEAKMIGFVTLNTITSHCLG